MTAMITTKQASYAAKHVKKQFNINSVNKDLSHQHPTRTRPSRKKDGKNQIPEHQHKQVKKHRENYQANGLSSHEMQS